MKTTFNLPSDTRITYERRFDAAPQRVWDAYTRPEIVRQWLGYGTFTTCEMDIRAGGSFRWVWDLDGSSMGIHGDVLEVDEPNRLVTTETMTGMDFPPTRNVVEFLPDGDGTILRGTIEYASKESRDAAYATGMADGMEDSFSKLAALVA